MKVCTRCGVSKPRTEYGVRSLSPDGLSSACAVCLAEGRKASYQRHREAVLARVREYKQANPEKRREWERNNRQTPEYKAKKKAQKKRRAAVLRAARRAVEATKKLAKQEASARRRLAYERLAAGWEATRADRERAKRRRAYNRRRAAKLQAVPMWFEAGAVRKVYFEAVVREMQVDHIVPLRSDLVCGLHCWANLQLLLPAINLAKSNTEWPDMP